MSMRVKLMVWIAGVAVVASVLAFAAGLELGIARMQDRPQAIYAAAALFIVLLILFAAILGGSLLTRRLASLVGQTKLAANRSYYHEIRMQGRDEIAALAGLMNAISSDRMKSEAARNQLVSDAAHELRTPVAILRGHMETMLAGAEELSRENLVPLLDETKRMSRLIQELQQLNLAEAGQLALDRSWVEFRGVLLEVTGIFEAEAEDKQIDLCCEAKEAIEVYCDPSRVKQVLINLIGNAIRYTPENGRVRILMQRDYEGYVRVEVADNGPGIPADKLPYIFHRFYRADESRSRAVGGTGLGLAIAKRFVEAHGGELSVSSEVGQGTVFVARFPVFPEA